MKPPSPNEKNFVSDLWGGFAAMLVALPSSIAFGVAIYTTLGTEYKAQGAVAGIVGAMAMGLVASGVGGAPRLISAPCAPAAAVVTALVVDLVHGKGASGQGDFDARHVIVLMTLAGLMCGLLQFMYGAAGGGKLIKYIPFPVVSGYLSGVGVLIFISQLPKLLGLPAGSQTWANVAAVGLWSWPSVCVGSATILGMLLWPKITKAVPGAILGLASGMMVYFALALANRELLKFEGNSLLIGPLGVSPRTLFSGFGERWTSFGGLRLRDLQLLIVPALTLSVLVSIDTLKTCVVIDALTRSRHNSNRTLIGQGLGNVVSALAGGMPGAGTMGPTLVNVTSGGQTKLSSVLEGVFVLVVFLLFGTLIGWVPIAALAGILIVVAFRMVDWHSFHLLKHRSTVLDFFVIAGVVAVAVEVDLIAAAGAGLGLAILLFIREQIRGSVVRRKLYGNQISSKRHRLPDEKAILEKYGDLTTVCQLQGSLFFGTTDQLFTELESDLKTSRFVILDMRRIQSVDFTAVHMLEQVEAMLKERNGTLIFTDLPATLPSGQQLESYFAQMGLVTPKQDVRVFENLDEAVEWAEDQILEEHRLLKREHAKPLDLQEIELFQDIESDEFLEALKECVEPRSYQAGSPIFEHGAEGDELFLIRKGIVRIHLVLANGGHYCLATFARGSFFGDMAFLVRGTRSADAIAVTDTEVFVISRSQFDDLSRLYPMLGLKLFSRLARTLAVRLRHTDSELRALQET